MARSIRWKATVALSILLCFSMIGAFAQSNANKNITYTCRAERLESVIEYLSNNSGYDFIYSPNLVDISQPVSLNVKNKSINEVLALIERQVGVSFKLKDRHIIVKDNPTPKSTGIESARILPPPTLKTSDSLLITSISRTIPVMPFESHAAILQSHLDKRIREVQKLLGPGVPRSISPYYISQINFNNRYKSWFASIGTHLGDNGSGLEFQAGLNYLYAVFQPRWTPGEGFCPAYGFGNSINLVGNFSFNTIYIYTTRTTSGVTYPLSNPITGNGPAVTRMEAVRQHQVKMAVQYAFSKNLSIRVGPVLNYRTTLKEVVISAPGGSPEIKYSYGFSVPSASMRNAGFITASRTRFFESWIGWDASIQYRINFFDRK